MTTSTRFGQGFGIRLSLFFAALFLVYGVQLPLFPVWLDWRGLSAAEIGLVTSVPLFLRLIIGPAAAFLADRSGDRRRAVVIAAVCGMGAVLALSQSHTLTAILLFSAVFLIGTQTTGPIGEAIALSGVRELGVDYGRMRVWGSVSFIAATLIGGAVVQYAGAPSIVWILAASAGALLAAAWLLPVPQSSDARAAPAGKPGRLTLGAVVEVAGSRTFVLLIIAVSLVQSSHAMFYVFGILHWQSQGISGLTIGVLWSVGVIAEVILFATVGKFLNAIGPAAFIIAGGVAAVVRWSVMAFDPPVALLLPLQILHALTFGATHFGAIHVIQRVVPQEQAGTAQSLLAAATGGLGMGAATLLSGILYGPFGGAAYLVMTCVACAGLVAALLLRREG